MILCTSINNSQEIHYFSKNNLKVLLLPSFSYACHLKGSSRLIKVVYHRCQRYYFEIKTQVLKLIGVQYWFVALKLSSVKQIIINDRIRKLEIHQLYERVQVPSSTLILHFPHWPPIKMKVSLKTSDINHNGLFGRVCVYVYQVLIKCPMLLHVISCPYDITRTATAIL